MNIMSKNQGMEFRWTNTLYSECLKCAICCLHVTQFIYCARFPFNNFDLFCFSGHNSQKIVKMSTTWIKERMAHVWSLTFKPFQRFQ